MTTNKNNTPEQQQKTRLINQILEALTLPEQPERIKLSWIQCLNKYDFKTLQDMLTIALIANRNKKPEVK